jgi:hypothetical protein
MTVSRVEGLVRQSGDSERGHKQSRSDVFKELLSSGTAAVHFCRNRCLVKPSCKS